MSDSDKFRILASISSISHCLLYDVAGACLVEHTRRVREPDAVFECGDWDVLQFIIE